MKRLGCKTYCKYDERYGKTQSTINSANIFEMPGNTKGIKMHSVMPLLSGNLSEIKPSTTIYSQNRANISKDSIELVLKRKMLCTMTDWLLCYLQKQLSSTDFNTLSTEHMEVKKFLGTSLVAQC